MVNEGGLLVSFRITGDDCPLAAATREVDAPISAKPGLRRSDGLILLQFTATGAVNELGKKVDTDERLRYVYVEHSKDEATFRCLSDHPCIQHELFDIGFMPLTIEYRNGNEFYRGAVIGHQNLQDIFEKAKEQVGVKLEGLQQIESAGPKRRVQQWSITPQQEEAIRVAVEMGYFNVPRDTTAEEVAERIGISQSAFLQRYHRAEKRIYAQMYDDE